MRDVLRFLARPGVYVVLVGAIVVAAAGCLWRGMEPSEDQTAPDPMAAIIRNARAQEEIEHILSDMAGIAYEEDLSAVPAVAPDTASRRREPGQAARMVLVMDDLGESMGVAQTLARLSFPVTFAVWPRSSHAREVAETGHAAGREIIIHQPTEPLRFPEVNPGPGALLVSLPDAEIEARVRDSLRRVPFAVGMNNHMGSRFSRDRRGTAAMVRPLKERGFFVLDSLTHPGSVLHAEAKRAGLPVVKRDIFIDVDPSRENVLRQLRKAERIALATGSAIAIGHPLPGTLAALKEWDAQRNTRITFVRLADMLARP